MYLIFEVLPLIYRRLWMRIDAIEYYDLGRPS